MRDWRGEEGGTLDHRGKHDLNSNQRLDLRIIPAPKGIIINGWVSPPNIKSGFSAELRVA